MKLVPSKNQAVVGGLQSNQKRPRRLPQRRPRWIDAGLSGVRAGDRSLGCDHCIIIPSLLARRIMCCFLEFPHPQLSILVSFIVTLFHFGVDYCVTDITHYCELRNDDAVLPEHPLRTTIRLATVPRWSLGNKCHLPLHVCSIQ